MFDLGEKLRKARLDQNLSLRELAGMAEVSASLLSQIENGKANPSVRSLYSIVAALALPMDYFFPRDKTETEKEVALDLELVIDTTTPGEPGVGQVVDSPDGSQFSASHGGRPAAGPVVRADSRPTIELEGGVTWARLTSGPEDNIEFLRIRYEVGARSGTKMSHHSGREFMVVLEGELRLELGFENYLLGAGDSVIFDSTTPHRLINTGQIPLIAMSVIFNRG